MTVLKPTANIKKSQIKETTVAEKSKCDEEKIEIQPNSEWSKTEPAKLLRFFTVLTIVIGTSGVAVGLLLVRDHIYRPHGVRRYQGYCSIPLSNEDKETAELFSDFRTRQMGFPATDFQVISEGEERADALLDALREELDIAEGVEKISVIDNGRRVDFIHDFTDNTTGIIDEKRCFVMGLEPELVLSPELFISGLKAGAQFDVSRVRTQLRAALPALAQLRLAALDVAARCRRRPLYLLQRQAAIRKRSADEPQHDYIQFSGKHVQEIKIENLSEILEYERQNKA